MSTLSCCYLHSDSIILASMATARKLFRLFKTINEYQKILALIAKGSDDDLDLYMNILSRILFGAYWLFDNLAVLSAIKFLKQDRAKLMKSASWCWFLGLLAALVVYVRNLINVSQNFNTLEKTLQDASAKERGVDLEQQNKDLGAIRRKRIDLWLNIVKTLGDMITASQGAGIPKTLTGLEFGDGAIGLGGFISATITNYQLY